MFKKIMTVTIASLALTACASDKSPRVTSLQKKDKNLSCSQVQLEINEAEFYRKTAEKNKSPKIKSLLMPIGYVYTYVDAEKAIEQSDQRIDYLNRIYDILDCDNPAARAAQERATSVRNRGYAGSYSPEANQAGYVPQQQYYQHQRSEFTEEDEWYW